MGYIKEREDGEFDFDRNYTEGSIGYFQVDENDPRALKAIYPEQYDLEYFKSLVQKQIDNLLKISNDYLMEDYSLSCSKNEVLSYRKELKQFTDTIKEIPKNGIDGILYPIDPTKK